MNNRFADDDELGMVVVRDKKKKSGLASKPANASTSQHTSLSDQASVSNTSINSKRPYNVRERRKVHSRSSQGSALKRSSHGDA